MTTTSRLIDNAVTRDLRTTLIAFVIVTVGLPPRLSVSGVLLPDNYTKGEHSLVIL